MRDQLRKAVLAIFRLNTDQCRAVVARGKDVVVTAGAGSGKTSTLVARYLHLLADGIDPRRIAAITFTRKAALEMRSRVRETLEKLKNVSKDEAEERFWDELAGKMDSSRIGTIHSLCAEILRNHPAEAGIDPRFVMLDESLASHYRNLSVEDTLNWMVTEDEMLPLFRQHKLNELKNILNDLLQNHLEARDIIQQNLDFEKGYCKEVLQRLETVGVGALMSEIDSFSPAKLKEDCGNLALRLMEASQKWQGIQAILKAQNALAIAQELFDFRWGFPPKSIGKRDSQIRKEFFDMREAFDKQVLDLVCDKDRVKPSQETEESHLLSLSLLEKFFARLDQSYQNRKDADQALDFDDLEYYTQRLLRNVAIREKWQAELQAVLVDEYQDTNQRQREIVNALAGQEGKLFIVGDMRQSIYRFRRADVTVFREEQARVKREGGEAITLQLTYRSHAPLLDAMGELLEGVIGTEEDPTKPHFVPFTAMEPFRQTAPETLKTSPVEFVFGEDEETIQAREKMAQALAARLWDLKKNGTIEKWEEVAILCRAASAFPVYETALERAGIPFVTVAGKGFYERPEIRDVLNILRSLADPADKAALVGLLRSPAFGLSDSSLLRISKADPGFGLVAAGDISAFSADEQEKLLSVRDFLSKTQPLVNRVHVGELLSQIVDQSDYRAILNLPSSAGATAIRLWRNLDKLINEAVNSNLINVREFLNQLDTFNAAGAREGEAVSEADEAVSIMTIHKSKGLQFPVVVLGDASRGEPTGSKEVLINPSLGISLKQDPPSLAYLAAKQLAKEEEESEKSRLLYVALTRAKDLLIINGHINDSSKPSTAGWNKELIKAIDFDLNELADKKEGLFEIGTPKGLKLNIYSPKTTLEHTQSPNDIHPDDKPVHPIPLYRKLEPERFEPEEEEPLLTEETQIAISSSQVRARTLGSILHKILQRWVMPGDAGFEPMLEGLLNAYGIGDASRRESFRSDIITKLQVFASDSVYQEIDSAQERYAELPFTKMRRNRLYHRVIDLIYRHNGQWYLIDFKSDPIESEAEKNKLVKHYYAQVAGYKLMVEQELNEKVAARICFLSDRDNISVVEI